MSGGIAISPKSNAINKTRNAILRIKNCSPKLRAVLRQRCQERIQSDRTKILNAFRKIKIEGSPKITIDSTIYREEWETIKEELLSGSPLDDFCSAEFDLDKELLLEELLEKELISEYENWLLQEYEELLKDELDNSNDLVCPLCCLGFLKIGLLNNSTRIFCTKCTIDFFSDKPLSYLKAAIFDCLAQHDKQCNCNPRFVEVPKNENENNLCLICHHCSFLSVIL